MISLDRLLRHISENSIGAAKGDDRHLREEQTDFAESVRTAKSTDHRNHWGQPQYQPHSRDTHGPVDGRPRVVGQILAEETFRRRLLGSTMSCPNDKSRGAGARADI